MKLPLIYVEWDDHHANGSWQEGIDHTPALCCSVGWIVKEDKKAVTIAGSIHTGQDAQLGNTQYILKSCIRKRKIVRRPNAKAD